MINVPLSPSDPLHGAAVSFVTRLRRGERPTLAEYTERYPDHANRIREIFPGILAAERRTGDEQTTGPFGPVDFTPNVPKSIGDYAIVREIGRGGMGIVYEAVQNALGRQVALKILPVGPCSRGPFLDRFRRESRAAARLHHTNIVPVFGVGESDGTHYYAMQYIEGMGLDAVLREVRARRGLAPSAALAATKTVHLHMRGDGAPALAGDFELGPSSILPNSADPTPETEAPDYDRCLKDLADLTGPRYFRSVARLGVQAAEALAYAHGQGVLHRDVKPSNLLLDKFGILWITDFGLAKAEGDDLTGTGDIVGTLRYMAPERFQALSDNRSDVYALGMTLYELLTLRPAFDEDDRLKLVQRITSEKPRRPRQLDKTIPADLETIVLKSIQKDPNHRYSDAAELADDLRRYLTDRPIKARRATALEELRRWCRRNPSITGLIGLVMMLWVILVAVVVTSNLSLLDKQQAVEYQKRVAENKTAEANQKNWEQQQTIAQLRRAGRNVGQRFEALDALVDAWRNRPDPTITASAIASLALPDLRPSNPWDGWPAGSHAVDVDPSFERYARCDREGGVSLRWISGDIEYAHLPGFGGPSVPLFNGDGTVVAVRHEQTGRLQVWRVAAAAPQCLLDEPANVAACAFSPADRTLAYLQKDGTCTVVELAGGKPLWQAAVVGQPGAVAFHPDNDRVTVATDAAVVHLDSATGRQVGRINVTGATRVAWHPRGSRLAVAFHDGRLQLFAPAAATPPIDLEQHPDGVTALLFHPDGDWLVTTGGDNMLRVWDPLGVRWDRVGDRWEPTGGRLVLSTPSGMRWPRFSRDGKSLGLAVSGQKLAILEVATGRECRTLCRSPHRGRAIIRSGAVSPDGRLLAAAARDGVTIWDLTSGEELAHLPLGDTANCVFLPDGDLLTSGASGVFRWPTVSDPGNDSVRFGPPRQLASWPCEGIACSRDGSVVAAAAKSQGAVILDRDRPAIRSVLLTHESAANVSVDPPGRLIATGTTDRAHVRVWDAVRNRLLREVSLPIGSIAVFSPDGRWLATGTDGENVQLWDVKTWGQGHRFPADRNSPVAFSPDGQLIAVRSRGDFLGGGGRMLWLYRTDTSDHVAALADPAGHRASWIGFSPDGRLLLAAGPDSPDVRVWDLPALRADLLALRLVEMGRQLDGRVLPEGPPQQIRSVRSATVVGTDLLEPATQSRWAVAVATAGVWSQPDDAEAYVRRAAALTDLGFTGAALNDLNRALLLRPDHAEAAYLRGLEHTRRRQWDAAVVDFTRAAERPDLTGLARFMRGKTLLQLNRVEEMMSEVDNLIRDYPGDPQLYYLRALGHSYRGQARAAIADLELALKLGPNHDLALNNLAWQLSAGPVEFRDPKRALTLVRHAVSIAPEKATYRNTLGVVLYRLQQYGEAADALSQSVATGKGQFDGYNFCFLSMCAARRQQMELARDYLVRAREWRRKTNLTAHEAAELDRFEDEAAKTVAEAQLAGRS